ncbi:MAG: hypothetical protein EZS28_044141, partial [Streblomastix strix]
MMHLIQDEEEKSKFKEIENEQIQKELKLLQAKGNGRYGLIIERINSQILQQQQQTQQNKDIKEKTPIKKNAQQTSEQLAKPQQSYNPLYYMTQQSVTLASQLQQLQYPVPQLSMPPKQQQRRLSSQLTQRKKKDLIALISRCLQGYTHWTDPLRHRPFDPISNRAKQVAFMWIRFGRQTIEKPNYEDIDNQFNQQ